MVDERFYTHCGPFALSDIIALTGAEFTGDRSALTRPIQSVAPLDRASGSDISFFDNVKYVDTFKSSAAGACFVRAKFAPQAPESMAVLVSQDPYRCFALVAQKFYPASQGKPSISDKASIAPGVKLGKDCIISPFAVIGSGASIGDRSIIGPNTHIDIGVSIGQDCQVGAGSTLSHCLIGNRVIIHRNVNIGQDGFGFAMGREGHVKVPQLGRVLIEDDVEIGSGTCIDRGSGPDTVIGSGTKIDNLVQIGHNVQIGKNAVIIAQVGISGSTRIGDGAVLAGQAGLAGHIKIGAGARVAAQSGVMGDIPAGAQFGGYPAVAIKEWHRQTLTIAKLANKRRIEDD